ncbi:hypothetical protein GCM10023263_43160 [Phytohabitans rumicis]
MPGWGGEAFSRVPDPAPVVPVTVILMYASTHPWRSTAFGLCGAAALALLLGLGAGTDRSASALTLASDAVVMPSAAPLPAEPASVEPIADDAPAASSASEEAPSVATDETPPALSEDAPPATSEEAPLAGPEEAPPAPDEAPPADSAEAPPGSDEAPSVSDEALSADGGAPVDELAEPTTAPEEPSENLDVPFIGPPQPRTTDLDCADFEQDSFRIDPNNDPHGLDRDNDGIACEAPPGD